MYNAENLDYKLIKEYNIFCVNNEWNYLFQRIKNNSSTKMSNLECSVARNVKNRLKNTYREIVPYDFNRVTLALPSKDDTDYINGSNIRLHGRHYVVTQYPDWKTVHLFWTMVWQAKSQGIIMLGRPLEDDGLSYYPTKLNEEMTIYDRDNEVKKKMFVISTVDEVSHDGFIERKLLIDNTETNERVNVVHFEFWSWPDQSVPHCMQSLLTLLALLRQYKVIDSTLGPPVVHCSAGAGRSGTFCLIDTAILIMEKDNSVDNVNIPELMKDLRCQRMGMVRTFVQLQFCYEAVIEAFKRFRNSDSDAIVNGSYLLTKVDEPHYCPNDFVRPSSTSSDSEDAASEVVMYIASADDSDGTNDSIDSSTDLSRRNSLETSDSEGHRWYRQEVLHQRKQRNQQKIALLTKHLEDNKLRRFRLLSSVTSTSLSVLNGLNSEHHRSMLLAAGAVLCMGTVLWLKYCPFKCS